jgi:hypothetical protein
MEVKGKLHVPATLPQGKEPQYPLDRRLGALQSHSGRGGEEKNSKPLLGIKPWNPNPPAYSLVTILTELSQLLLENGTQNSP